MEFPDLGVYVAVRDSGKFAVAEWEDDCVFRFSDNGRKVGSVLG